MLSFKNNHRVEAREQIFPVHDSFPVERRPLAAYCDMDMRICLFDQ